MAMTISSREIIVVRMSKYFSAGSGRLFGSASEFLLLSNFEKYFRHFFRIYLLSIGIVPSSLRTFVGLSGFWDI